MTIGIYVSGTGPQSGKSIISLGLTESLHTSVEKIGYFRPLYNSENPHDDPMLKLVKKTFDLKRSQVRGGISIAEANDKIAAGQASEISQRAIDVFSEMSNHCDVIIIEGITVAGSDPSVDFNLNTQLANNLGAVLIGVLNVQGMKPSEAAQALEISYREFNDAGVSLFGFVINRVKEKNMDKIAQKTRANSNGYRVLVFPELVNLTVPSVKEIAKNLNLKKFPKNTAPKDRDVSNIKVAAMTVSHYINQLEPETLVVVPGDRTDIILATIASALSPEFPAPAAIILTGDLKPSKVARTMLQTAPFPVFYSKEDTYTTATHVSQVESKITSGNPRKISTLFGEWNKHVSRTDITKQLALPYPQAMTPIRFLHKLVVKARSKKRHIVLPEGQDERILRAAEIIHRLNVCDLTILGDIPKTKEFAKQLGVNLTGIDLIDPMTSDLAEEFTTEYQKARAHKGVTAEEAKETMESPNYFGTMMVQLGYADGMVSGAANTTAATIRPALEFIKTADKVNLVSSVFFMLMKDRVLVYGDCAVNPDPNSEQLADIAIASAQTSKQFDIDPKIAMLSYSTGTSGSGEDVEKVREATKLVQKDAPDLMVEGPIQYDAAVNASTAASKLPESEVAGQANVFIFPDLNTGNNTYKAVQQSAGAVAVGPVLQGLKKPVNDLSRGCTIDDIVNTVAITAIQAQERPH